MKSRFGIDILPKSWTWANLKDITRTVRDGTHNPPARVEKGYPLLSARNVKEGYIDWSEAYSYISENDFLELNNGNPIDNQDILLTIVGTIGRSSVNRESTQFAVQRSVAIIKTFIDYIDPIYLQHLFNGPKFRKLLGQNSKGTAQKGVYLTSLKNLQIPLAPLPEQHRIVARIEELFSHLDAGVQALQKAKTQLQRYRQAVLKAAVEGRLTAEWQAAHLDTESASAMKLGEPEASDEIELSEIPREWFWSSVEQLASAEPRSIQSGPFGSSLHHSEFQDKGILAIGIDNVLEGKFSMGKQHRISLDKFEQLRKFAARPLDVLITVMATVGRCCIVPANLEEAIITKHVYRISVNQSIINPYYLMYSLLGGSVIRRQIFRKVRGQTRPGINGSILKQIKIPVPSLAEQFVIISEIERLTSIADNIEAAFKDNLKVADHLRQSILKRAFEGRLVPQDPSDEPASMLLERIRAERAKTAPVRRAPSRGKRARDVKQSHLS